MVINPESSLGANGNSLLLIGMVWPQWSEQRPVGEDRVAVSEPSLNDGLRPEIILLYLSSNSILLAEQAIFYAKQ